MRRRSPSIARGWSAGRIVESEPWSVNLQFAFTEVTPDLLFVNPIGLVITFLDDTVVRSTREDGGVAAVEALRAAAALEEAGFAPRAARFVALVVLAGGVFVREFAARWIGDGDGRRGRTDRFLDVDVSAAWERAFRRDKGLVHERTHSSVVYHCRGKGLYRAIGAENSRYRRQLDLEDWPRVVGQGPQGVGGALRAGVAVGLLGRGAARGVGLPRGSALGPADARLRGREAAGVVLPGPAA